MTIETHDLTIEQDWLVDGHTAHCSCGWSGRREESAERAVDAWENHCDIVFMEATS